MPAAPWMASKLERVNSLLFGYYGGIYISKNVVVDTTGKTPALVGYGYTGSSNSQNKAIQEITFGMNQTVWANPRYGAINLICQYEYLTRNPWYVGTGPDQTHDNTIYFDVRYTLPGSMPKFLARQIAEGWRASRPINERDLENDETDALHHVVGGRCCRWRPRP